MQCNIENGRIITDLYTKPTSVVQYLLPSSAYPHHITKNIPYSLGYRLLRICSDPEMLLVRLHELKNMLLDRDYRSKWIDNAFERVLRINREDALQRVERKKTTGKLTFISKFDPRLPDVNAIVKRHFNLMIDTDSYLKRVFTDGVQVAYARHRNLRDLLCRAKLYPVINETGRSPRLLTGWKRCMFNCMTCKYSRDMKSFKCTATGETINIIQKISCTDSNIIYVIECLLCRKQYVGRTSGQFRVRMNAHYTNPTWVRNDEKHNVIRV